MEIFRKGTTMLITKYINIDGPDYKVSEHFTLGELACPGTNKVIYDPTILAKLEKVRAHFGGKTKITSSYRTKKENTRVGGSSNSGHLYGRAIDFIQFDSKGIRVSPKQVVLYLEMTGWLYGICMMETTTHIDSKFKGNKIDETKDPWYTLSHHGLTWARYFGYKEKYSGLFPTGTVSKATGSITNIKRWQMFLCWWGADVEITGVFDAATIAATKNFQDHYGLRKDGSVGNITKKKAQTVIK